MPEEQSDRLSTFRIWATETTELDVVHLNHQRCFVSQLCHKDQTALQIIYMAYVASSVLPACSYNGISQVD